MTGFKRCRYKYFRFKDFELKPEKEVILHSGTGTDSDEKLYWNSRQPIWNNKHDTLYLRDCNGLLIYLYDY